MVKFFPISLEILEEIFLNLPPGEVVRVCRVVCHQWKEVVDSKSLWKERCRREGDHLSDTSKNPEDWRLFYFLCKQRRNLLKNPRGQEELSSWLILNNDYRCFRYGGRFGGLDGFGGNRWAVHGIREPHPDETVPKKLCDLLHMAHVFKNYGPGVRYVIFTHGGRDTQFWAGWYGIRLTESCVEICPAVNQ
ncbi:hypothetical protein KUCAC02_012236 [Chaenocephalus aceratus]|uniref:Uncharacterized protein n=1 Tax=Chaenocephalus aceratus TaxID=36190 RepID=A0ACB9XC11_CHAAC|nr:hypothetical protein KUCAC02_012236 [Chaenocephalus aceratus]